MPSTIVIKNSSTASAVPTLSDLTLQGEIAVNVADKKIFTRDHTNAVVELGAGDYTITAGAGLTGTGTVDSEPTLAVGAGTGISVNANDVAFDTTWGDARYLQSYSETDTLATVTGRGASTSTALTFNGNVDFRANVDLADNNILRFGTGDDCELFCNGVHMYMDLNAGISNFYIRDGTTTRFTFNDAGAFTATGNITAYSDVRLKDNIQGIMDPVEKLRGMGGYTYDRTDMDGRFAGVLAQEVRAVLPEAVKEMEDGYLSVDYNAVLALVIEAVLELDDKLNGV